MVTVRRSWNRLAVLRLAAATAVLVVPARSGPHRALATAPSAPPTSPANLRTLPWTPPGPELPPSASAPASASASAAASAAAQRTSCPADWRRPGASWNCILDAGHRGRHRMREAAPPEQSLVVPRPPREEAPEEAVTSIA